MNDIMRAIRRWLREVRCAIRGHHWLRSSDASDARRCCLDCGIIKTHKESP